MNFAVQTTDWRGLCEELLRELENCIAVHYGEGGTHHISAADAVIARANIALAEPHPSDYKIASEDTKCFASRVFTCNQGGGQ